MQPLALLPPALLLLLSLPLPSQSFSFTWPFPGKRFTDEGLIDAGSLGLGEVNGRIAAVGNWNGESQFLDVFSLSDDQRSLSIYSWDHASFSYRKTPETLEFHSKAQNVVPGDFNYDGKLDLLVMLEHNEGWWNEASALEIQIYTQDENGHFNVNPLELPSSTLAQPMVIDATGDLKPDLLGFPSASKGEGDSVMKLWQNVDGEYKLVDAPLDASKVCTLANPHSNAFVDLDGDCLADVFLHCTDNYSGDSSFQIWLNRKEKGYVLAKEGRLPKGTGQVTFADMDRDGTLDMVFPTCSSFSTRTGIGKDCSINIAYNQQIPLCSATSFGGPASCRDPQALCSSDPGFSFDFREGGDSFTSFPLSTLFPGSPNHNDNNLASSSLLLFDVSHEPSIPIPLRAGDYNLDGYPDLMIILATARGGTTVRLLQSEPCSSSSTKECGKAAEKGRRRFREVQKGAEALKKMEDVRGASFMDVDEDGSLDMLIQRTGKQTGDRINFIQNNYFHDAFFLKTLVLNGACQGLCQPVNSTRPKYHPFGVSYSGASVKFTILDTSGRKAVTQVAQLPQTSYLSLQTPYSLFGLGRTNNYVENLFVGTTLHSLDHFTSIEGVIPNSQVVISPPSPSPAPPALAENSQWSWELYLHPGEYVPWVTFSVFVATVVLAGVVGVLHVRERKEDEAERRRALHRLNFSAM
ncbi:hypothetical protein BDY24DRAFT_380292 [Mrakia frigida]|uniref:FG-GAP repeat domain-containing protein n=1 Tax=Mrakia frigida TaxID=29902 RepID=UPI003FCC0816